MHVHARFVTGTALAMIAVAAEAVQNDQYAYVTLAQPCRILDTRAAQGGAGALTAAHGNYKFGVSDTDVETTAQNGSSTGCGIPTFAAAISASINQLNTTNSGNIRTWSTDAGTTGPTAGSAVYNPSVATPSAGQVLYSGAAVVIPLGATDQRFYLAVANGQLDMTINAVGYWQRISTSSEVTGPSAASLGFNNGAYGAAAMAFGSTNYVTGNNAAAIGQLNQSTAANAISIGTSNKAMSQYSTVIGENSTAAGVNSVAIGNSTNASGINGVAIGAGNDNEANNSVVLGTYGFAPSFATNSFVFNDGSSPNGGPGFSNVFWVKTISGAVFYTSADFSTGVRVASGSGSWTAVSDRNAKTAVQRIDGRDVLDRVVAMPLATWQYKAQDAKYRHMGPMAQDFYAAFGLGESDTGIDTIDADGVALAAIQGLKSELDETRQALAARDRDLAELRAQVAELAATIKH